MKNWERMCELVTGYIDGELNDQDRKKVERLLKENSKLHEHYTAELQMKDFIQTKTPSIKAPHYLKLRIKRQIARSGQQPSFLQLVQSLFEYKPLASSVAVAVLSFLILFPGYQMIQSNGLLSSYSGSSGYTVTEAKLEGEIICLDCDIFNSGKEAQLKNAAHDASTHRPGLRAEDGSIWTILYDEANFKVKFGRELLKKRAVLAGLVFQNSRYIRVQEYKLL